MVPGWLIDIARDSGFAVRMLRKSPGFALTAIATLALGVGATTAISSIVETILLRPLPFADADRLVRLVENVPHVVDGRPPLQRGLSHGEFLEWRSRSATLSDAAAVTWLGGAVPTDDGMARLSGAMVTPNTFAMLGVRAAVGRTIETADAANRDVIVLTDSAWRLQFRADPAVVGKTVALRMSEQTTPTPVTVIGVLPPAFEFPVGSPVDFFRPFLPDPVYRQYSSDVIGRLAPGVSRVAAVADANLIGQSVPARGTGTLPPNLPRFEVQGLKDRLVASLQPSLRIFLAAVVILLLIVCANVANLLLARGTGRQREIAVRLAVGASRGRVVRQVLTECGVLAIAGGALGAVVGAAGVALVKDLASIEAPGMFRFSFGASLLPRVGEIDVDGRVLAIAIALAALTCAMVSVLPALQASRTSHLQAMGPRGGGARRGASRMRSGLVVAQLVLATVLLVGAGLLTRSFVGLTAVDRGYDAANVLAFQLVLPYDYATSRKTEVVDTVLARLRSTPGVVAAGFTRAGMMIREEIFVGTFVPPGRTADEMRRDPARPRLRPVSPSFLTAMGVPVLAGRDVAEGDAPLTPVPIVITRSVAQQFFGSPPALGRLVDWHATDGILLPAQVVGVVEDIRNDAPERQPAPEIFTDYRRVAAILTSANMTPARRDSTALGILSFAVRTAGDEAAVAPLISQAVRAVDPNVGVDAILPMPQLVANSVARPRFSMMLLAVFAAVAGLLAVIGIYGVLAYAVVQRTHEIGVRMALGARRADVLSLVLRRGAVLSAVGIALGLASAAAASRLLQGLLFGVTPLDPATFAAVSVTFGLAAMLACYLPARRASTVDPAIALRTD